MKNLLYKEFRLLISPLFFLVAACGALILIPQWVYFMALMYFFFITVPNIFTVAKAQNDIIFTVMLPVRRCDVVRARVMSVVLLELLQIVVASICVFINMKIYPAGNFLLDANIAFIGFVFIIFGVFNVIMFPMFYKTAYKIALAVMTSITAALLLATAIELFVLFVPFARVLDGTQNIMAQIPVLAGGMMLFALLSFIAYKVSVKRFMRVDV